MKTASLGLARSTLRKWVPNQKVKEDSLEGAEGKCTIWKRQEEVKSCVLLSIFSSSSGIWSSSEKDLHVL